MSCKSEPLVARIFGQTNEVEVFTWEKLGKMIGYEYSKKKYDILFKKS